MDYSQLSDVLNSRALDPVVSNWEKFFSGIIPEAILLVCVIAFMMLLVKLFSNLKILGKEMKIAPVIVISVSGMLIGLVFKYLILGGNPYPMKIIPSLSLGVLATLFYFLAASMNFQQIKKVGLWTVGIAFIALSVESIVVGGLISWVTGMDYMYSLIGGTLIAGTSISYLIPKIIGDAQKGYGSESQTLQLGMMGASLENLSLIPFFVISIATFVVTSNGSEASGLALTGIAILVALIQSVYMIVFGIIMAVILWFVIKPISKAASKTTQISLVGLEGKELEEAQAKNSASNAKVANIFGWITITTIFLWAVAAQNPLGAAYPDTFFANLPTILWGGSGISIAIAALVAGFISAWFGSKNELNKMSQQVSAGKANKFYATIGVFVIIGFGMFAADPVWIFTDHANNQIRDWEKIYNDIAAVQGAELLNYTGSLWNTAFPFLPHLMWICVFMIVAIALRYVIIILLLLPSSWTMKQAMYVASIHTAKGVFSINNGATLLFVLGTAAIVSGGAAGLDIDPETGVYTAKALGQAKAAATSLMLQEVAMSSGVFIVFTTYFISVALQNFGKDRWLKIGE